MSSFLDLRCERRRRASTTDASAPRFPWLMHRGKPPTSVERPPSIVYLRNVSRETWQPWSSANFSHASVGPKRHNVPQRSPWPDLERPSVDDWCSAARDVLKLGWRFRPPGRPPAFEHLATPHAHKPASVSNGYANRLNARQNIESRKLLVTHRHHRHPARPPANPKAKECYLNCAKGCHLYIARRISRRRPWW
jgi:hypothetical protein